MKYKLLESANSRLLLIKYLLSNLRATRGMQKIPEYRHKDYTFDGLSTKMIPSVEKLHQSLRKGRPLGFWKKLLLKYRGRILCGVVLNDNGELIGFQLHTFKADEVEKGILHIEFSCIEPQERNKSIASSLRKHVARHYADQGLKGLSAYTPVKNLAAAEHVGYQVVSKPVSSNGLAELYFDLSPYR